MRSTRICRLPDGVRRNCTIVVTEADQSADQSEGVAARRTLLTAARADTQSRVIQDCVKGRVTGVSTARKILTETVGGFYIVAAQRPYPRPYVREFSEKALLLLLPGTSEEQYRGMASE